MYAVIKTGGKQHKVKPGDVIEIEVIPGDQGQSVTFTPILIVDDEGKTHFGKELGKAAVTGKLLGEKKGDKVRIFKYRPKTGYTRRRGHRQEHTFVEIEDVALPKRAAPKKPEPATPSEAPGGTEAVPTEPQTASPAPPEDA